MSDSLFLSQALAQAWLAMGLTDPNPRVGCVLVSARGEVLGQGHTQEAGGPHAEVMAMRDAQARGLSLQGATAYVTLEPCSHHGRTPPCADALLAAGVGRVVVALLDPNPQVAGQGVARLRAAGIAVEVLAPDHPQALEAREVNLGFLSRMVRQRPWVRLKVAASLDGRTALDNGQSQWITGPAARSDGHAWRARATAVLTGIGTVLDDNPRLDVREVAAPRQPWRVVLDSCWRTPPQARLLESPGHVLIYGLKPPQGDEAALQRQQALGLSGAELMEAPAEAPADRAPQQASAQVDLAFVLSDLAARGVNELHVEAGARLNAALIQGDWVDEVLLYLAPKLIGPGRGLAAMSPLSQLSDAWQLSFREFTPVGDDLRVIARPPGRDQF
ncbi:MAG: bifunctional diaminohydroxyphosphoribosylaminopyrimidine deaminase/5-amino-6-(5-phosphoribosylamino)uracil reductase RibD [Pseudomonadota bacterium]